jgi:MerR family transcriptional regulator, Zn(II)-responsive regulator of zntA
MTKDLLTIGQLAKRGNVSTSLLRYYEKEKLLTPSTRSDSGYRLYSPESERALRFIRSAQRYGFSLNDIRIIVSPDSADNSSDNKIINIAEQRSLEIERRITEMLVLRHELELFLDDLTEHVDNNVANGTSQHYRDLVEEACRSEHHHNPQSSLRKLVSRLHCNLASEQWEQVFSHLRSQHLHIWRDEDQYSIQFTSRSDELRQALETITAGEHNCEAHEQPELISNPEGFLFVARGDNAFLYAQLFLAMESAEA